MKPTILAIDSSTSACSVALLKAGVISQNYEVGSNIHSQRLLEMTRSLLESEKVNVDQVDAIAVGQGPGSFTGLRIGIGVAQGLAYGAGCPMLGVSSLATLAAQSEQDGIVLAGIDARMQEIYWGLYEKKGDQIVALGSDQVSTPADVPIAKSDVLIGNAWAEYESQFEPGALQSGCQLSDVMYPTAKAMLLLAEQAYANSEFVSPIDFAPQYIRNDVAKKSSKKSFV